MTVAYGIHAIGVDGVSLALKAVNHIYEKPEKPALVVRGQGRISYASDSQFESVLGGGAFFGQR